MTENMTDTISIRDIGTVLDSVLAYGHFNSVHPGHIRHLKSAKEIGTKVVVAVIGDQSDSVKNFFSQTERAESLALLKLADIIVLLDGEELDVAIEKIRPNTVLLGKEHQRTTNKNIMEAIKTQKRLGGVVKYDAGETHYATSELLGFSQADIRNERTAKFLETCRRQSIQEDQLIEATRLWANTKIVVIGDTIVDQYVACEALGLSAEAPVVVVRELENKNFVGGAAIVASHIRALGAQCHYISVVGNDQEASDVIEILKERDISFNLIKDKTRPTTFKRRYVVENQKLFRVSRLDDRCLSPEKEDEIIQAIEYSFQSANGVVVSDFVYGLLTPRIINHIQVMANKENIMLFGDVQCSSQVGNIAKLKNFTLLCPNEREARIALQDKDSGIEKISHKLITATRAEKLVMKLGAQGFIAYNIQNDGELKNEPFPALSVNPVDVTGAGDSLLAVMAIGLASGQEMMLCSALACCMASTAVDNMGNTPITKADLLEKINRVFSDVM
ncbi:PfkB family carbohydrate kinase [Prochlorococcus marinus]|uniref:Putative ADP-heptose synthase n=1 Tax=Prochlorococcus marinus (strain MIT 9303) TaxID=59922 RepID=A2C5U5_PROM3|nr:PfkB family carbohydrate kinase [Prochlorococcus marinus]ABM76855.1 putative ADP-heptose synthase [Prochlorococcus marinus str. MIT 9303]